MLGREEMRPAANKYQDKYQNELINVSSTTLFFTPFLNKKRWSEYSGFHSTHNVSPYNHPFSFTGKEKDAETGFSYFSARYYDSDLSGLFLSVDPMADKYPSISPYAYWTWNPVKLVDINGEEVGDYYTISRQYLGWDGKKDGNVYFVNDKESIRKFSKVKKVSSDDIRYRKE